MKKVVVPTIYALATGRPPAAIAIIRVSGRLAHEAGRSLAGELPLARQAAVRALRSADGELLDEALVLRFDGRASATGEDVVEFHCHGSRAVVDAVLGSLGQIHGLRMAEPGEFTRRAFENGRLDFTQAEGLADLLEAETQSQRRAALAVAGGGLRQCIEAWQAEVVELSARAEAAIDYVGEDDVGPDPGLAKSCRDLAAELEEWLARPRVEPLRDGLRVVIAGPPNSGKSSLLNVIAGRERAIVSEVAGTTRDEIELPVSVAGMPLVFVDTAGLRTTGDEIERIGVERSAAAMATADILLWLGDAKEAPQHPACLIVASRCDLDASDLQRPGVRVSSLTGQGIHELLQSVTAFAKTLLPQEGAVALNRRQARALAEAAGALGQASEAGDEVLLAEGLRTARSAFDRLTGKAGMEDVLDQLFGRFCLGK